MAILVGLNHLTRYIYDRPVALGPQIDAARPAPHCRTKILSYCLKVSPPHHFVNWQQDPHGNWQARFVFPEKVSEFKVEVDLTADLSVVNPFDFFIEPYAEHFPFAYEPELKADLAAYLQPEPPGPLLDRLSRAPLPKERVHIVDFLVDLNAEAAEGDPLCDPHGARRTDARRDAGAGARAPAAIPPGSLSRSCAISASRRASSPAI